MDEKTREFLYKLFELEPLLKELKESAEAVAATKSNGYERVSENEPYYFVNALNVCKEGRGGDAFEEKLMTACNYYSSQELAMERAYEENLLRRLRKFSAEAAGYPVKNTDAGPQYRIAYYDGCFHPLKVKDFTYPGEVLFHSEEGAQNAINLFIHQLFELYGGRYMPSEDYH